MQFRSIASYETVVALRKIPPARKKKVLQLKELKPLFFIGMSEESYPGYRRWLVETCRHAAFSPRVLQDVEIERSLYSMRRRRPGRGSLTGPGEKIAARGRGFPEPFRPRSLTESCIAWKADNPSSALKAYIDIVSDRGTRMR